MKFGMLGRLKLSSGIVKPTYPAMGKNRQDGYYTLNANVGTIRLNYAEFLSIRSSLAWPHGKLFWLTFD